MAGVSDIAAGPRAKVFTNWGTVLYVDSETGLLRHGDAHASPANAFLVAERQEPSSRWPVWLAHDTGDGLRPILCGATECRSAVAAARDVAAAASARLEIVPLERGLVGLGARGLFLGAEPDGRMMFGKSRCSVWEFFLLSEDWRPSGPPPEGDALDRTGLRSYIVHPPHRVQALKSTGARKVLIYGYTGWSHGRVYYDLCKHLYARGFIVDLLDWMKFWSPDDMAAITSFYDFFLTSFDLNGVRGLANRYGVPYERMIAISHSEFLTDAGDRDLYAKFANYGVTSYNLLGSSMSLRIPQIPTIVPIGINYSEFEAEPAERLATVGYASTMSLDWENTGVDRKRGALARESAQAAGLDFKTAGWTGAPIPFQEMPAFYRSVDCILMTSLFEASSMPIMEAAAAGRLVIGTPAGAFPLRAYQGGGILAPVAAEQFKDFTVSTLRYYKDNPEAFRDKCRAIQQAARQFDWQFMIDDWVAFIQAAKA
jgi:glycosyltransferase involved in cell wall biosynthesis